MQSGVYGLFRQHDRQRVLSSYMEGFQAELVVYERNRVVQGQAVPPKTHRS